MRLATALPQALVCMCGGAPGGRGMGDGEAACHKQAEVVMLQNAAQTPCDAYSTCFTHLCPLPCFLSCFWLQVADQDL